MLCWLRVWIRRLVLAMEVWVGEVDWENGILLCEGFEM